MGISLLPLKCAEEWLHGGTDEMTTSRPWHGLSLSFRAPGQKEIAAKIREKQGDYVASLKQNHPTLEKAVRQRFVKGLQQDWRLSGSVTVSIYTRLLTFPV